MGRNSGPKRELQKLAFNISDELLNALEEQKTAFRAKFGRDAGPDDPLIFDPDADTPQMLSPEQIDSIESLIVDAIASVGVDPAIVYATKQTGFMVSEANQHLISPEQLQEWQDAIAAYRRMLKEGAIQ